MQGNPSGVFAIYFAGIKPTFNDSSIGGRIIETVEGFTPYYRWSSTLTMSNGILEIWEHGDVLAVKKALQESLPGATVVVIAN